MTLSIEGVPMAAEKPKRRTAIYCPQCGHMEVKARICDIEMQCRRCNYKFEAVIGPYTETVRDSGASEGEPDVPNAKQASPSKFDKQQP